MPVKFTVGLAAGVNVGVGFDEGLAKSSGGRTLLCVLQKGMRNNASSLLAGLFTDGMRAHAVGDEEKMAALPPLGVVGCKLHRQVVLVVAATDSHVRQAGIFKLIEAVHRQ